MGVVFRSLLDRLNDVSGPAKCCAQVGDCTAPLAVSFFHRVVYGLQIPVVHEGHHDAQTVQFLCGTALVMKPIPIPELLDVPRIALQSDALDCAVGRHLVLTATAVWAVPRP